MLGLFDNLWFYAGPVLSLMGMARSFIGGTALSLFIIKSYGLHAAARPTFELFNQYLDIAEPMVSRIPWIWYFAQKPFDAYIEANRTYSEIIAILLESEFPATCEWYWQQPGYPEKRT